MPTEPEALHVAVLASAQTMPNLESVVALAAHQPLAAVHVYWTDFPDSRRAAESLERVLGTMAGRDPFRSFRVEREEKPGTGQLENVVAWLRASLDRSPGGRWVLNATGGTKPMAAGFLMMADHPGVESVIYRELSASSWLALRPAPRDAGRFVTGAPPPDYGLAQAGSLLDRIPLVDLLRAQLGYEDLAVDPKPETTLDTERLARWIEALDPNDERPYREAARRAGIPDAERASEGTLFERLCHGVLASFGLGGLAHSVEVRPNVPGESRPAHNEIDFFVRHEGRIRVLDLKLTSPDGPKLSVPKYDQIRTVAEATRSLAGIDARPIMLRPNWLPERELSDYAEKVHRVRVVDATGMPRIFEVIAEELGYKGALPEAAKRLQDFFEARRARGLPSAGAASVDLATRAGSPILELDASLRQSHAVRGSHWAAAYLDGVLLLRLDFSLPFDPLGTDLAARLEALKSGTPNVRIRAFVLTDKVGQLLISGIKKLKWVEETATWTPRFLDCRRALHMLVDRLR